MRVQGKSRVGFYPLPLKWIRLALRQKLIEVPDCNGPVRWSLGHSFFPVSEDNPGEGSGQEISDEISAATAEEARPCESS